MTAREYWVEELICPKCQHAGSTDLSQANGEVLGNHEIRVENVSDGFRVVALEFGSSFYCAVCGSSAEHKTPTASISNELILRQ